MLGQRRDRREANAGMRLLKISATEAYEEEFFRRAFRFFNEDFRPLNTRLSARISSFALSNEGGWLLGDVHGSFPCN